jgi:ribonuclease HII
MQFRKIRLQADYFMKMYQYEKELWGEGFNRVMGLDEVGRGCLSGPVVAAGVIIDPAEPLNSEIRDSKKLSLKVRKELAEEIRNRALFWTVQHCMPDEIDRLNILKASIRAMLKCTEQPQATPDFLLVDGNRFTPTLVPHRCIIKGDDNSASIAAASILAKVHRDDWMARLHEEYPHYGWDSNVGYPTKVHYEGLQKYGYTPYHRKSFKLRTDREFGGE